MDARPNSCNRRHQNGAATVEYGLIVVCVATVIVLAVVTLGRVSNNQYTDSCDTIRTQIQGSLSDAGPTPTSPGCEK